MSIPPLNIFTLPLFPLHTVLFPHVLLQLYIFEERYKVMINACIEHDEPFGVVLIREGEEVGTPAVPYNVGCMARILAVKRLEDGRMHLVAAGERRFRLLDHVEAEIPYLLGRVEILEDRADLPEEVAPLAQELNEAFQRYLTLLAEQAGVELPDPEIPDDPVLLSYYIAYVAQLDGPEKQKLLELSSVLERLQAEKHLLHQAMEELNALHARHVWRQEAQDPSEELLVSPIDVNAEHWKMLRQQGRN